MSNQFTSGGKHTQGKKVENNLNFTEEISLLAGAVLLAVLFHAAGDHLSASAGPTAGSLRLQLFMLPYSYASASRISEITF